MGKAHNRAVTGISQPSPPKKRCWILCVGKFSSWGKKSHAIGEKHPGTPTLSQIVKYKCGLTDWLDYRGRSEGSRKKGSSHRGHAMGFLKLSLEWPLTEDGSVCTKAALDDKQRAKLPQSLGVTHLLHLPCAQSETGQRALQRHPDRRSAGLGAGQPRPGRPPWGRCPAHCRKDKTHWSLLVSGSPPGHAALKTRPPSA